MPRPEIKKKKPKRDTSRACTSCHYFWFRGLIWHCFHPDHDREIKKLVGCDEWQAATKKIMPNKNGEYIYDYPARVDEYEDFER